MKTPHSGYQEGFVKGSSFATVFDKREYYETFIRQDNNKLFGPGMQNQRNRRQNATFIWQNQTTTEDFNAKV